MDEEVMNDRCCLNCSCSMSEEGDEDEGDLLWCNEHEVYVAEDELCGEYN